MLKSPFGVIDEVLQIRVIIDPAIRIIGGIAIELLKLLMSHVTKTSANERSSCLEVSRQMQRPHIILSCFANCPDLTDYENPLWLS